MTSKDILVGRVCDRTSEESKKTILAMVLPIETLQLNQEKQC